MLTSYFAELSPEELEVIQELEQALSHIKGRHISLVAYDLGEAEAYDGDLDEGELEYDEASIVSPDGHPSSPV